MHPTQTLLALRQAMDLELSGNELRRIADPVFDFIHVERAWQKIWPEHDAITRPHRPYVRREFLDIAYERVQRRVARIVHEQGGKS